MVLFLCETIYTALNSFKKTLISWIYTETRYLQYRDIWRNKFRNRANFELGSLHSFNVDDNKGKILFENYIYSIKIGDWHFEVKHHCSSSLSLLFIVVMPPKCCSRVMIFDFLRIKTNRVKNIGRMLENCKILKRVRNTPNNFDAMVQMIS